MFFLFRILLSFTQKIFNRFNETRDIVLHCFPYGLIIDIKIYMHKMITHTYNLIPWNLWMEILVFRRNFCRRFSYNLNCPQNCMNRFTVILEIGKRISSNKPQRFPGLIKNVLKPYCIFMLHILSSPLQAHHF